ncbi:MAG: MFS transporter, partial [Deltaproteobacteria bacterium]|nr:MFS transporter [Deltaproteobacteria bacterium]
MIIRPEEYPADTGRDTGQVPQRWIILLLCSGFFAMSMLLRSSTAVIATSLSKDLNLSLDDLGLLGAALFYTSGLVQIPLGVLLDRIGPRLTLLFLNAIGVAGVLVFALAGGLTGGLTGRVLMGVGMAANLMAPLILLTRWFKAEEFGTVSGLIASLGSLGGLFTTTPMVISANWIGWRGVFIVLALILASLTVALYFWVSDDPPDQKFDRPSTTPKPMMSLRQKIYILLTDRSYWSISLAAGLRYGAFAAVQTLWVGPFLMIHLDLEPITAGNILLMLSIGSIIGPPLGGYLSDKILKSRKKAGNISMILLAGCLLAVTFWPA